ncbi:MAG: right-handed parallel beta-helix repeat-containing protein [Methanomassiliicoccales archaeon]
MKRTIFLLGILALVFVMLFAFNANASAATEPTTVYVQPGTVDGTWTNDNVYIITGDIQIAAGQKLTIEENTTVKFDSGVSLAVDGTLVVNGTDLNMVTFTANSTSPGVGYWEGIQVNSTGYATFKNVNMSYADVSIFVDNGVVSFQNVRINNTNTGIDIIESNESTTLAFSDITIENYYTYGIHVQNLDRALSFSLTNSELISADSGSEGVVLVALDDFNGTLSAVFNGVNIEGGYVAVSISGGLDTTLSMTDCNFIGQDDVALNVESVFGSIDMGIEDSVIDGTGSLNSYWLYTVETVDYEFEVIPYDPTSDNQTTYSGDTLIATLPFTFSFAGEEISYITMDMDGLYIGSSSLYPTDTDYLEVDGGATFFGFVVYEDRAVFQWSLTDEDNYYLENLYEVVVYANGEIQVNYNMMESDYWGLFDLYAGSYHYEFVPLLGNPFDNDYTSFLISGDCLSAGTGVYAGTLLGDVMMTITDSTISNFDIGAIYGFTDEGYIIFEMTGSTVEWINNYDWDAAINLWTEYGAMDILVDSNYFNMIYDQVFEISSLMEEADDEFVDITNNEFNRCTAIGYIGTELHMTEDAGIAQEMSIDRNFSGNTLMESGELVFYTYSYLADNSTLDLAVSDSFVNNTCDSELYVGDFPLHQWDTSYQYAMFYSYNYYENDDNSLGNETLSYDVTATGNNFVNLPAMRYYSSVRMPTMVYAENDVYFSGEKLTSDMSVIVNNNDFAMDPMSYVNSWDDMVEVGSDYYVEEGDLDVTEAMLVNDNSFTSPDIHDGAIYLWSDVYNYDNWDALKSVSVAGTYEADRNNFEGMMYGAYIYLYRDSYNAAGTESIDDIASFNENTLVGCGTAIYIYAEGDFYFQNYFPLESLYDGENTLFDVEYNTDVEIMDNVIECVYDYYDYNKTIDVEMGMYAGQYGNAPLTSVSMTGATTIAVIGNEIMIGDEDIVGIYIDVYFDAWGRDALSDMTLDIAVVENVIGPNEDGYGYFEGGIWVYTENEADTYEEEEGRDRLMDTPVAKLAATVEISDNIISGSGRAIYLNSTSNADGGASMEFTTLDALISGNEVYNCSEVSIWADIRVYVTIYDDMPREFYPCANDTRTITISQNLVDSYFDDAYGIEFDTYFELGYNSSYDDEWVYFAGTTTFLVEDNEVSNVYVGIYADAYGYFGAPVESYILDNIVATTNKNGIEFVGDHVEIVGNILIDGWTGIDIEYASGLISENEINTMGFDGINGYNLWDMVISDNVITMTGLNYTGDYGIELYYLYNVTVSGNIVTENVEGMYIYEAYECSIVGNTVDDNIYDGAYFYGPDYTVIEGNSFSSNGGNGAEIYYGWDFVFGNNTVVKNMAYGLSIQLYDGRGYLYNNELSYNEWNGLAANTQGGWNYGEDWIGLIWIIDDEASVVMNGVSFEGEIEIREGGILDIESVEQFSIVGSDVDGTPTLLVEGTLNVLNSYLYADYYFEFEIYGTVNAELSEFEDMYAVYIAEGSQAEFRICSFSYADEEAIFIDNASPVFSMCTMVGYDSDSAVVWIQGEDANPTITGGIIMGGMQGIYAKDTSLGNVFDTIFMMNEMAGIYGEGVTGKIHDNVFMLNGVAIMLQGSNVTIEDNEIGWTIYIDALAEYAPVIETLGHHVYAVLMDALSIVDVNINLNATDLEDMDLYFLYDLLGFGMDITGGIAEQLVSTMVGQVGVYAEDSVLKMSGNTYGMLYQCVYVIGGSLTFSDKIETRTLEVPYFIGLNTSSLSIPVQNVNGLYAVNADVVVDGAEISVVDDAIVLEGCTASIQDSVLDAGDFDIFAMSGSEVSVSGTSLDKIKSEDSNTITLYCQLQITAVDNDGDPVSGRTVKVYDDNGTEVASGKTDSNGVFTASVVSYEYTDEGKSDAMTYTVKVDFKNGDVSSDVVASEDVTAVTVTAEKDNTTLYIGVAIVGIAVLLIAVVLLMRAKKP